MSGKKKKVVPKGVDEPRWLLLYWGCELSVYSGPHLTQRAFVNALVNMINEEESLAGEKSESTAHILTIHMQAGKPFPVTSDFSSAFMDSARRRADSDKHDLDDEDDVTLGLDND